MNKQLPPIYSFPPLYTRQPNALIRQQQLDTWCDLVVQYAKQRRAWCMGSDGTTIAQEGSLDDSQDNEESIFLNSQIQRSVPSPFVEEIWARMLQSGKVIKRQNGYYVLWKDLDSWSSNILQWFETTGKLNQVVTIYELLEGDESIGWEFHGMNPELCEMCLEKLCSRGRATTLKENGKIMGVKVV